MNGGTRRGRRTAAVSAGLLVVAGAVSAALINELHGGWLWWVLAGTAVAIWAVGTGLMAMRGDGGNRGIRVGDGGVYAGGSIRAGAQTRTTLHRRTLEPPLDADGVDVGAGAVFAGEDICGAVGTETTILPAPDATSQLDPPAGAPPRQLPPTS